MKKLLVLSTAAVLAACAPPPAPVVGPMPTQTSASSGARPTAGSERSVDSTIRSDSIRRSPQTQRADDSAQVSAAEVSKRAAESAAPKQRQEIARVDQSPIAPVECRLDGVHLAKQ